MNHTQVEKGEVLISDPRHRQSLNRFHGYMVNKLNFVYIKVLLYDK